MVKGQSSIIFLFSSTVVRNLRYRRGKKELMWIHGPKGNHQMCQTVAHGGYIMK